LHYRPQLDSIRCFALFGVLYSHWWNSKSVAGYLGVRLFFALSGFLITKLLLEDPSLLRFYLRRAARLLPAYYLTLAVALVLNLPGLRATWWWHFAMLTNIYFYLQGGWEGPWPADHLWSLSVEWQFYLVYPLIVMALPRRSLPFVLTGIVAVGLLYNLLTKDDVIGVLPFASVDALAVGALMAIYTGPRRPIYIAGALLSPFVVWALFSYNFVAGAVSIFCFAAIVLAAWHGALTWIEFRPLIFIGRISYGFYLFHLFVWAAIMPYLNLGTGFRLMAILSIITGSFAWLSFRFIETPFRSWANRGLLGRKN
jgi:peptidoglycan/LPS O-acetylase OafA/YrhL